MTVTLKVLNPTGVLEVAQPHAPRLPDLDGKTIGELSNGVWDDQRTFPFIRGLLQKRFPRAKFVPFSEFPIGSEQIDSEAAIDLLQQKGCDAVITGNAA
jgi:ABC-type amino acid transport substrate-binding protein